MEALLMQHSFEQYLEMTTLPSLLLNSLATDHRHFQSPKKCQHDCQDGVEAPPSQHRRSAASARGGGLGHPNYLQTDQPLRSQKPLMEVSAVCASLDRLQMEEH